MSDNFSKILSGLLSSVLLLESCTGSYIDLPVDEINRVLSRSGDCSSAAIPIRLELSKSDVDYIEFLKTLADDICKDPKVAQQFVEKPQAYLGNHGFNAKFASLDSHLTRLVLQLGDEEVCSAITNNDIPRYLDLMKQKGLIRDITINDLNSALFQKSEKGYVLNENLLYNSGDPRCVLFYPWVVVGVCVAVWAIAVEYLLGGNAVCGATAFVYKWACCTDTMGKNDRVYETLMESNVVEVFTIKSQDEEAILNMTDAYIRNSVDGVLSYLKDKYPAEVNKYNENDLRTAILANIVHALH